MTKVPGTNQALLSGEVKTFLSIPGEGEKLVECFGSPLHVVFPENAIRNANRWKTRISDLARRSGILFAYKSCKSSALGKAFASCSIGADVSSREEFLAAVENLVPIHRIAFTGPDKPVEVLSLATTHQSAIHVDSVEELRRLLALLQQSSARPKVFLRLKPGSGAPSRFGLSREEAVTCFGLLQKNGIESIGLSYHLNNYCHQARISELRYAIDIAISAENGGISFHGFDIGGGNPLRYCEDYDREMFKTGSHLNGHAEIGNYPYSPELSAEDHAAHIVQEVLGEDRYGAAIERLNATIYMQPGRSLLDQCGLSLFRIIGVKPGPSGQFFVIVDGMSFSLSERWFSSDFAPTPLLLPTEDDRPQQEPRNYFLVGRSCLESDIIRNKAVSWSRHPREGDIVCFANTAGYQMDSNESPFHRLPLPTKIAAYRTGGSWQYCLDNKYRPREHST